jgi:hypothetical protein
MKADREKEFRQKKNDLSFAPIAAKPAFQAIETWPAATVGDDAEPCVVGANAIDRMQIVSRRERRVRDFHSHAAPGVAMESPVISSHSLPSRP